MPVGRSCGVVPPCSKVVQGNSGAVKAFLSGHIQFGILSRMSPISVTSPTARTETKTTKIPLLESLRQGSFYFQRKGSYASGTGVTRARLSQV